MFSIYIRDFFFLTVIEVWRHINYSYIEGLLNDTSLQNPRTHRDLTTFYRLLHSYCLSPSLAAGMLRLDILDLRLLSMSHTTEQPLVSIRPSLRPLAWSMRMLLTLTPSPTLESLTDICWAVHTFLTTSYLCFFVVYQNYVYCFVHIHL